MSKKDYEMLAEALRSARPKEDQANVDAEWVAWSRCVERIARALDRDNGRFNINRFYVACGHSGRE